MFGLQLFLPMMLLFSLSNGDYRSCPAETDCPGGLESFSNAPGKIQTYCGPVLFSCDAPTPSPAPSRPNIAANQPSPIDSRSWKPDLSWNPTHASTPNGDRFLGNLHAPSISYPSGTNNAGAWGWLNGANWAGRDPLASQAALSSFVGFVQNVNAAWEQRQYQAMQRTYSYQPRQREAYMTAQQITAEYQSNAEARRAQMFERQRQSVQAENEKRAGETKVWREGMERRQAETEAQLRALKDEKEKKEKAFEEDTRKIQLARQERLERIKLGELNEDEAQKQKARLENIALGRISAAEAAKELNAFTSMVRSEKLPLRKRDLAEILSNYLDDRGLFRGFEGDGTLKNLALETSIDSENGQNIRDRLNRGLILYEYAARKGDTSQQAKALVLIDEVLASDQLFGLCEKHNCSDKSYVLALANRHLRRAYELFLYEVGDEIYLKFRPQLSRSVRETFHLMGLEPNSFENIQIIRAAHQVWLSPIMNDEILRMHAGIAIHQAKEYADLGESRLSLKMIDRALGIVDYSKGLFHGSYDFAADTIKGMGHLLLHPLDSAQAIVEAIQNYEKVYELISEQIEKIRDDYDSYSPMQKGQLHARIVFEVGSLFTSVGIVGDISKATRVIEGISSVAEELIPLTAKAKSIWSKTRESSSLLNALRHWQDHGREFPELQNALSYVKKATDFVRNPPPGTMIKIRQRNGDRLFYHPETNVFAITDANGSLRTMYKPNPAVHGKQTNLEYFNAQK